MSQSFTGLGVPADLTAILARQGITDPTPIQAATLPDSLSGRDVLGCGRTGSGKTLAFSLPVVTRLSAGDRSTDGAARRRSGRHPQALVLAPTRELADQIRSTLDPLAAAAGLSTTTVYGGVSQNPQVRALQQGVDIVVACPGRLEDLLGQGHLSLESIEVTVLDEADHMADLGFLPVVRRLLGRTPAGGQRLLFSATLDKAVDGLVKQFLRDQVVHQADSPQSPVSAMTHHVLQVTSSQRLPVLVDLASAPGRTVVFTRTKYGAKGMAKKLNQAGIPAVELHGNLGQNARTRNLDAFHSGAATTLVATDIAARGIHVDDVALVIHADPPAEHKAYLHRSGRTARAGAAGTVVTLATDEQRADVRALTKSAGISPTTTRVDSTDHPILQELAPGERTLPGPVEIPTPAQRQGGAGQGGSGQGGSGQGGSGQGGSGQGGSGQGGSGQGGSGQGSSGQEGSGRSGGGSGQGGGARRRSRSRGGQQSQQGSGRQGSGRQGSGRQGSGRQGSEQRDPSRRSSGQQGSGRGQGSSQQGSQRIYSSSSSGVPSTVAQSGRGTRPQENGENAQGSGRGRRRSRR